MKCKQLTTFYSFETFGEKTKGQTYNEDDKGRIKKKFSVKEESKYDDKQREISHWAVTD